MSTAELVGQLLLALAYVHGQGVIHRDLKPENLHLLASGRLKVLDFGLARIPDLTAVTQAGAAVGTLAYMAPEQLMGDPVGPLADLYATGVLLFELLTGRLPFPPDAVGAVLHRDADRLDDARPDVPRALADVAARAMSRTLEERYPSAQAFLEALRTAAAPPPASG